MKTLVLILKGIGLLISVALLLFSLLGIYAATQFYGPPRLAEIDSDKGFVQYFEVDGARFQAIIDHSP